jgi:PKHD-type hydroxylase
MEIFDYWLWDKALPKWFCEQQVFNAKWAEAEYGKINKNENYVVDKEKRITDIVWEDDISPIGCIAQSYINMANIKANWNFNLSSTAKIQIGKYSSKTNGFYDWHTDSNFKADKNGLVRKLSISILLSDPNDFEGGLFEFKDFEKQPELKQGSILVFPSFIEHRVTPVISGERVSAVTWVSGPSYK